jgi:hypothetical protein
MVPNVPDVPGVQSFRQFAAKTKPVPMVQIVQKAVNGTYTFEIEASFRGFVNC